MPTIFISALLLISGLQAGHIGTINTSSEYSPAVVSESSDGSLLAPQDSGANYPRSVTLDKVRVTAYSSSVDETDSTPFTTASGERVHDGVIAANFLPFGTKLMIPSLFGDKIFTVEDHMNRRLQADMDIWMTSKSKAIRFGVENAEVVVVSEPGASQLAEK